MIGYSSDGIRQERLRAAHICTQMRLLVDDLLTQGLDPERLEVRFSREAWLLLYLAGNLKPIYPEGHPYRYRGIPLRETGLIETGPGPCAPPFIIWYRL